MYVIHHPGIAVAKAASPATYDAPGTAITYTYTVVNTGDVTLHDVTLTDDRLGAGQLRGRHARPRRGHHLPRGAHHHPGRRVARAAYSTSPPRAAARPAARS